MTDPVPRRSHTGPEEGGRKEILLVTLIVTEDRSCHEVEWSENHPVIIDTPLVIRLTLGSTGPCLTNNPMDNNIEFNKSISSRLVVGLLVVTVVLGLVL